MLARAHKKFQREQHSEIYLLTLKEQDKTKIKSSLDMVSIRPLSAGLPWNVYAKKVFSKDIPVEYELE